MLLPKDDERKKHLLGKKAGCEQLLQSQGIFVMQGYIDRKLDKCSQLQKRSCSEQATGDFRSEYKAASRAYAAYAIEERKSHYAVVM